MYPNYYMYGSIRMYKYIHIYIHVHFVFINMWISYQDHRQPMVTFCRPQPTLHSAASSASSASQAARQGGVEDALQPKGERYV